MQGLGVLYNQSHAKNIAVHQVNKSMAEPLRRNSILTKAA